MPYAIFDYMGGVLPMWIMLFPWSKKIHGCSCQGCKATNHTGTFRNLRNPATNRPEPSPNLASGIYTNRCRNSPPPEPSKTFRANLCQHTSQPSRTPKSSGTGPQNRTYTILPRNSPEPTPAYAGTFRNLPPEPTPAYTGTFKNLPDPPYGTYRNTPQNPLEPSGKPSSGTCSYDPHRSLSKLKTPLTYVVRGII